MSKKGQAKLPDARAVTLAKMHESEHSEEFQPSVPSDSEFGHGADPNLVKAKMRSRMNHGEKFETLDRYEAELQQTSKEEHLHELGEVPPYQGKFSFILGLGEQFSIPETSGVATRVEFVKETAYKQEDSLEKIKKEYPLQLKEKQSEPKKKAYNLPQNMSPSPKRSSHFETIEGQVHMDPRFIEEGQSRLYSASNGKGEKLDKVSNREIPKELNNMELSFQEEYVEYLDADQVEEELNDNSALLDESQLNKCFELPKIDDQEKDIKALQKDVGYVPPKLKADLISEIKEDCKKADQNDFYAFVEQDSIEKIESHFDKWPLLDLRKKIMKARVYYVRMCTMIISHSAFDTVSILVIVANTLTLAMEDPLAEEPDPALAQLDLVFQILYTIEMVLKISGLGFVMNQGSYLRDSWNVLDFIIVNSGFLEYLNMGGADLSVLRSFRVLRPLRTISGIEGLRIIVSALMSSIPLLRDAILILFFFFIIFAIAGVQLFSGILKKRCISIETGQKHFSDEFCGSLECPKGYFCGKTNENPNFGVTSFDNIGYAFLAIFQSVTLEGWSSIMVMLEKTYNIPGGILFFIPIIFIGAFFLLNLTLAVIKIKFTEEHQSKKEKGGNKKARPKIKVESSDEDDNPKDALLIKADQKMKIQQLQFEMAGYDFEKMTPGEKEVLQQDMTKRIAMGFQKHIPSKTNGFSPTIPLHKKSLQAKLIRSPTHKEQARNRLAQDSLGGFSDQNSELKENHSAENYRYVAQNGKSQFQKKKSLIKADDTIKEAEEESQDMTKSMLHVYEAKDDQQCFSDASARKIQMKEVPGQNSKKRYQNTENQQQKPKHWKEGRQIEKKTVQLESIVTPQLEQPFELQKTSKQQQDIVKYTGNLGIKSQINREPVNREEMQKRKQVFEDFETSLAFDMFMGSDYGPDDRTQNGFRVGIASQERLGLPEEIKHNFDRQSTNVTSKTLQKKGSITKWERKLQSEEEQESFSASQNLGLRRMTTLESKMKKPTVEVPEETKKGHSRKTSKGLTLLEKKRFFEEMGYEQQYKKIKPQVLEKEMYNEHVEEMRQKRNAFFQDKLQVIGYKKEEVKKKIKENMFNPTIDLEKSSKPPIIRRPGSATTEKSIGKRSQSQKPNYRVSRGENNFPTIHEQPQDEILDMAEELEKTKKKLVIRQKVINFESMNDVIAGREENVKAEEEKELLERKAVLGEDYFNERKQIHAYQKKVRMDKKQFNEDLMNEEDLQQSSDDNEEVILDRLQGIYNAPHRSNVFVTGTLSIVTEKKKREIGKSQERPEQKAQGVVVKTYVRQRRNSFTYYEAMSGGNSARKPNSQGSESDKGDAVSRPSSNQDKERPSSKGQEKGLIKSPTMKKKSFNFAKNKNNQGLKMDKFQTQQLKKGKKVLPFNDVQVIKKINKDLLKSGIVSAQGKRNLGRMLDSGLRVEETDKRLTSELERKKKQDDEEITDQSEEMEEKEQNYDYFFEQKIEFNKEIADAKLNAVNAKKDGLEWNGQDILVRYDPSLAKKAIEQLSSIRVWPKGTYGYYKRARVLLKSFVRGAFFDNFMTICVAINTVVLAMDRYGIDSQTKTVLTEMNNAFTWIFIVEMGMKLAAVGLISYCREKMNYLDGAVVILSIVELVFLSGGGGEVSAFQTVRIFRTFRVLRVARLLRSMKSMMNIIQVISRSISSFIYLAMLLFLFLFIYALLGMQIYGNTFNFEDGTPRTNYDSFNSAFITSFVVLSMENWQAVMYDAMRTNVNWAITAAYFISWIFLGNFMLLNLFLAILLDSFAEVDQDEHMTPEQKAQKEIEFREQLKLKTGQDLIEAMSNIAAKEVKPKKNKKKKKKKGKKKKKDDESNMLDESQEIGQEAIDKEYAKQLKEKNTLFNNIECQMALFVFSQKNKLRIWSYKIVQHGKFETVILILIVLSSIKLIYDTYLWEESPSDPRVVWSDRLDYFFTVSFAVESLLKSLAFGFIMENNSYLRESWSQLDFFIVVTSLIDAGLTNVDLPVIKILRLLRILRPLRFISHNSSMKTVVTALLQSLGPIINVGIVVMVVFLMFAILGVNLFGGKFQYCTVDTFTIENKVECFRNRGSWETHNSNFDSVPEAMMTLFIVASLEGWPDIMAQAVDSTEIEKGPREFASPIAAYFFVIFVLMGSFFFMNLFVGVIFMNFEEAQREEKEALFLQPDEVKWVDMISMILKTKPEIIKRPKNRVSVYLYEKTKGETPFDIAIMTCIVLNMILMACSFEGQSEEYTAVLEGINYFFTAIFALEALLKMIGSGWSYFYNSWNKFDFFVVISSFVDIVMSELGSSLKFLRVGPQLARVLRILRVSRLFRLVGKAKGLQALIQTITFSMPSLMNVFALLLLVFFIFSVLGVFLFGKVKEGENIDDYMNFWNFGTAMIINLRCSTGEDWNRVVYDLNKTGNCIKGQTCGSQFAYIYFIMLIMVVSYVMLNLFILVILQQFELYYLPDNNALKDFGKDLEKFKNVWMKYSKEHEGIKVKNEVLEKMFGEMGGKIGMQKDAQAGKNLVVKNIIKMNLEADDEGFVYFNDLLYKSMFRIYGIESIKNRVLFREELNAFEKLKEIRANAIKKSRQVEKANAIKVNPFLTLMYKNMSFSVWKKEFDQNFEKRRSQQSRGINRSDEHSDTDSESEWKLEYELEEVEIIEDVESEPGNEAEGQKEEDLRNDPAFKLNLQQTQRANEQILLDDRFMPEEK